MSLAPDLLIPRLHVPFTCQRGSQSGCCPHRRWEADTNLAVQLDAWWIVELGRPLWNYSLRGIPWGFPRRACHISWANLCRCSKVRGGVLSIQKGLWPWVKANQCRRFISSMQCFDDQPQSQQEVYNSNPEQKANMSLTDISPRWHIWLLASAWPSPAHCGKIAADRKSLWFFVSLCNFVF